MRRRGERRHGRRAKQRYAVKSRSGFLPFHHRARPGPPRRANETASCYWPPPLARERFAATGAPRKASSLRLRPSGLPLRDRRQASLPSSIACAVRLASDLGNCPRDSFEESLSGCGAGSVHVVMRKVEGAYAPAAHRLEGPHQNFAAGISSHACGPPG